MTLSMYCRTIWESYSLIVLHTHITEEVMAMYWMRYIALIDVALHALAALQTGLICGPTYIYIISIIIIINRHVVFVMI